MLFARENVFMYHDVGGAQVQDLLKGESDEDGGKGGRALAVQDVNAPPEYVWDRILDFGNYNKMVGASSKNMLLIV